MLKLHKYAKEFRPEKRLYNRKPVSKIAFIQNKTIHIVTINNN